MKKTIIGDGTDLGVNGDILKAKNCLPFSVDFSPVTKIISQISDDYTTLGSLVQNALSQYNEVGEELDRELLKLESEELNTRIDESDIQEQKSSTLQLEL